MFPDIQESEILKPESVGSTSEAIDLILNLLRRSDELAPVHCSSKTDGESARHSVEEVLRELQKCVQLLSKQPGLLHLQTSPDGLVLHSEKCSSVVDAASKRYHSEYESPLQESKLAVILLRGDAGSDRDPAFNKGFIRVLDQLQSLALRFETSQRAIAALAAFALAARRAEQQGSQLSVVGWREADNRRNDEFVSRPARDELEAESIRREFERDGYAPQTVDCVQFGTSTHE